jgi:hypothetical protein
MRGKYHRYASTHLCGGNPSSKPGPGFWGASNVRLALLYSRYYWETRLQDAAWSQDCDTQCFSGSRCNTLQLNGCAPQQETWRLASGAATGSLTICSGSYECQKTFKVVKRTRLNSKRQGTNEICMRLPVAMAVQPIKWSAAILNGGATENKTKLRGLTERPPLVYEVRANFWG